MQLVYAGIICLLILNLIPWIWLIFKRPDLDLIDNIDDIDENLGKVASHMIQKLHSLESFAEEMHSPSENLDLGSIIGQFLSNRMNQTGDVVYSRSHDGTFNGAHQIQEVTPSETTHPSD